MSKLSEAENATIPSTPSSDHLPNPPCALTFPPRIAAPWEPFFPLCITTPRNKRLPASASRIFCFFSYSSFCFPSKDLRYRYSFLKRISLRSILSGYSCYTNCQWNECFQLVCCEDDGVTEILPVLFTRAAVLQQTTAKVSEQMENRRNTPTKKQRHDCHRAIGIDSCSHFTMFTRLAIQ